MENQGRRVDQGKPRGCHTLNGSLWLDWVSVVILQEKKFVLYVSLVLITS